MTITLMGADFNRIMQKCAPAASKDDVRLVLQHIEICHDGSGTAYATALDGRVMNQVSFACQGDAGTVLLRRYRTVGKYDEVTITWDEELVSVSDGETTITRKALKLKDIDRREIARGRMEKPLQYSIAFDPRLLREALKAFGAMDKAVVLEFSGSMDGVLIRGEHACAMALPMRLYDEKYKNGLATFYGQRNKQTHKGEVDNGGGNDSP